MERGLLLWLIGIALPTILLVWDLGGLNWATWRFSRRACAGSAGS